MRMPKKQCRSRVTAISASDGHPNGSSASRFREFRQLAGSPQPNGPGLIGVLAYYPGFWILLFQFGFLLFGFFCFSGFCFSMASFLEILVAGRWCANRVTTVIPFKNIDSSRTYFSKEEVLEKSPASRASPQAGEVRGSMIESLPLGSHFALTRLRSTVPRRYGHRV